MEIFGGCKRPTTGDQAVDLSRAAPGSRSVDLFKSDSEMHRRFRAWACGDLVDQDRGLLGQVNQPRSALSMDGRPLLEDELDWPFRRAGCRSLQIGLGEVIGRLLIKSVAVIDKKSSTGTA